MSFDLRIFYLSSYRIFFSVSIFIGCLIALTSSAHAGRLYVLNQQNGSANFLYCFNINETNGALTLCPNFPTGTGGTGINSTHHESIAIDRANRRLYVLNRGSDNVGAFSIDTSTGSLTPLPFSPIFIGDAGWSTIAVHPSGSPLVLGERDIPFLQSYKITATTFAASGRQLSLRPFSSEFSRDGNFFYVGGLSGSGIEGLGVHSSRGQLLNLLPGSPFDSLATLPGAYAADSQGRLFSANYNQGQLRVFTSFAGVLTQVNNNPFTSGLTEAVDGVLHPNEKFYYVTDRALNRVGAYSINGEGAATTLGSIANVSSLGLLTSSLAFNQSGSFLFAANGDSRNISRFNVNPSTGSPVFGSVQPVDTLGSTGRLTGIAYLPNYYLVSNTNDSGAGSLRQAVADANAQGGGVIIFDPQVFTAPKTISLSSGVIDIDSNIEIFGPGANILTVRNTRLTSSDSRVFRSVRAASNVKLKGMTITGGNSDAPGAGIGNDGILGIAECNISGNTTTVSGGGIFNTGVMNIINSTISANKSSSPAFGGGGAGIFNQGRLFLTNTTISGNLEGAGIVSDGAATILNSTITNNLSSAFASGVLTTGSAPVIIGSTIIAGNQGSLPDVSASSQNFLSRGFNFIGNRGSVTAFNQTGDQTGNSAAPIDAKLVKVLAYNGGTTPAHALLPNSPAVDKGNRFGLDTDQRLFDRTADDPSIPNAADGADIGAYERQQGFISIFTAPFDFDGDGKTDISIFRPSVGEWWVNRSSTGATFAAQFGAGTDKIAPGDFTGDGKADIAFWRPSDGFWFILRSENLSFFSFPFGATGDIPAPADFDGDAKTDPAVFRPSAATWFISRSSGGTTIMQFGANGDVPVPGDYDHDGKFDIAIYRPSLGQWWVNQSSNGLSFAVQFGGSNDKPVPGDYTGDLVTDMAFWRPSTGEWFVLRSEDGVSFFSFPFGANGDIPAPGDYDGDGKSDAAVYRPSNNLWFAQTNTAGTLIQQFGSAGDKPVPSAFVP